SLTAVELISTPTSAGWLLVMTPTVISPCHQALERSFRGRVLDNGLFTTPQPFHPLIAHQCSFLPLVVERLVSPAGVVPALLYTPQRQDRKSTRLNSSHVQISYARLCVQEHKS